MFVAAVYGQAVSHRSRLDHRGGIWSAVDFHRRKGDKTPDMGHGRAGEFQVHHQVGEVRHGECLLDFGSGSRKIQLREKPHRGTNRPRSYYRGAIGALLVYDVSRRETFNHLAHWLRYSVSRDTVFAPCHVDRRSTVFPGTQFSRHVMSISRDTVFAEVQHLRTALHTCTQSCPFDVRSSSCTVPILKFVESTSENSSQT